METVDQLSITAISRESLSYAATRNSISPGRERESANAIAAVYRYEVGIRAHALVEESKIGCRDGLVGSRFFFRGNEEFLQLLWRLILNELFERYFGIIVFLGLGNSITAFNYFYEKKKR